MRVKRFMLASVVFTMLGTVTSLAADSWGYFQGYHRVKVEINNQRVDSASNPGFVVDGTTFVPLRSVADSLNAVTLWSANSKTVDIIKPNVHLMVAKRITSDFQIKEPFGKVQKNQPWDFSVFAQVDSSVVKSAYVKITIVDPYGDEVFSSSPRSINADSIWLNEPVNNLNFKYSGKYMVRFHMKTNGESSYSVISEKSIISE